MCASGVVCSTKIPWCRCKRGLGGAAETVGAALERGSGRGSGSGSGQETVSCVACKSPVSSVILVVEGGGEKEKEVVYGSVSKPFAYANENVSTLNYLGMLFAFSTNERGRPDRQIETDR